MSVEKLEDLKAIIDNAPRWTTHSCYENGTHYQFKISGLDAEIYGGSGWIPYSGCALPDLEGMRSLSDIKRIIELMEATQGLLQLTASSPDGYWRNEINAARKALGLKV